MKTNKTHPFVFVNQEDIERAKRHVQQRAPWATQAQAQLLQKADEALALEIPTEYPYAIDTAEKFGEAGLRCATAYLLTDDRRYLDKAKAILLGLARGFRADQTVLSNYSLDFCRRLPSYVYIYDALYPALAAEDRRQVEHYLLMPAARAIQGVPYHPTSNIRSWQNLAVGSVGFALENGELAGWAIHHPDGGFKFQLSHAVGEDGLWWEGSPAYHLYALIPLTMLAEAARRSGGENIYLMRHGNQQPLKQMFDSLFQIADPNLILPNNNDSTEKRLPDYAGLYELAYGQYQDPTYAWLLSKSERPKIRSDIFLLEGPALWGWPLGRPVAPTPAQLVHKGVGWATMRSQDDPGFWFGDARFVLLDYGPHGGAHGHADKLHVDLVGYGRRLSCDRSQYWYSEAAHDTWERQTLAHNTVVIDQRSQPGARVPFDASGSTGRLLFHEDLDAIRIAEASADDAYAQKYQRLVVLTKDYVIDLFDLSDSDPHTYDWVFHGPGDLAGVSFSLVDFSPYRITTSAAGYPHLSQISKATSADTWSVTWPGLRTTMAGSPGTDIIRAQAPGGQNKSLSPMVIARRVAAATRFVALHEPFANAPRWELRPWTQTGEHTAIEITAPGKRDLFVTTHLPKAKWTATAASHPQESITLNGKYGFISIDGKRLGAWGSIVSFVLKDQGVEEVWLNGKRVTLKASSDSFLRYP